MKRPISNISANLGGVQDFSLCKPMSMNSFSTSIPTNLRPISKAATPVLATPANGSNTKSSGAVDARMHRSINPTGFCVGCFPSLFSSRPGAVNFQTVFICLPPFSDFITS